MREIQWRLDKIIDRSSSKLKTQAQLAGMEIKIAGEADKAEPLKLSEEQEKATDAALVEAQARLRISRGR